MSTSADHSHYMSVAEIDRIAAFASSDVLIGTISGNVFTPVTPRAPGDPLPSPPAGPPASWVAPDHYVIIARDRMFVSMNAVGDVLGHIRTTFGDGAFVVGHHVSAPPVAPGRPASARNDRLLAPLPGMSGNAVALFAALGWCVVDVSAVPGPDDIVWQTVVFFRTRAGGSPVVPVSVSTLANYWDCAPGEPPVTTAHSLGFPSSSSKPTATVLVLDSGLAIGMEGRIGTGQVRKVDVSANSNDIDDTVAPSGKLRSTAGHGSFVASIVRRLAPDAEILVADVCDAGVLQRSDTHLVFEDQLMADLLRGLAEAETDDVVVNLSIAGATPWEPLFRTLVRWIKGEVSPFFVLGFDLAKLRRKEHVEFVAAAGNRPGGNAAHTFPARLPFVTSVGSLDDAASGAVSWFSCTRNVDVWAVGSNVIGPFPSGTYVYPLNDALPPAPVRPDEVFGSSAWATWGGTSFATAVVSGRVAAGLPAALNAQASLDNVLATPLVHGKRIVT